MSLTNFSLLQSDELTVWERTTWMAMRKKQFLNQFTGSDENAMIQRIDTLTQTKKGARAIITLVKELEGDGRAGDRTLEGNEEAIGIDDMEINIDQLRHANRHEGKMADQKSVVRFRKNSQSVLAYWLADRADQLAFLTMSGVAYSSHTDGRTRTGSDLPLLSFAADVTAPTSNRHFQWDADAIAAGNGDLIAVNHNTLVAADTLTWKALILLRAQAEESQIRPVRMADGVAYYNVFVTPTAMAALKDDDDFKTNLRNAAPRSTSNPVFKGAETFYVDGLAISSYRHVYNTRRAASGSKWGSGGTVDGCRVLMCGAQALAYADITRPEWVEKGFDYDNQQGISVGKIFGYKKPVFDSQLTGTTEDFGVICLDVAQ